MLHNMSLYHCNCNQVIMAVVVGDPAHIMVAMDNLCLLFVLLLLICVFFALRHIGYVISYHSKWILVVYRFIFSLALGQPHYSLMTFLSLTAPEIVKMTISSVANDHIFCPILRFSVEAEKGPGARSDTDVSIVTHIRRKIIFIATLFMVTATTFWCAMTAQLACCTYDTIAKGPLETGDKWNVHRILIRMENIVGD